MIHGVITARIAHRELDNFVASMQQSTKFGQVCFRCIQHAGCITAPNQPIQSASSLSVFPLCNVVFAQNLICAALTIQIRHPASNKVMVTRSQSTLVDSITTEVLSPPASNFLNHARSCSCPLAVLGALFTVPKGTNFPGSGIWRRRAHNSLSPTSRPKTNINPSRKEKAGHYPDPIGGISCAGSYASSTVAPDRTRLEPARILLTVLDDQSCQQACRLEWE